jgi:dipeptidyl aminopeptidase/acylaminoacyl peptidase
MFFSAKGNTILTEPSRRSNPDQPVNQALQDKSLVRSPAACYHRTLNEKRTSSFWGAVMAKAAARKTKKRSITAEDLYKLRVPTSVSISPDEKLVTFTVERMDKKEKKYFTNICMCDLATGEIKRFTTGNHVDQKPVWSPDGQTLAFVSTRDKKTGVYTMPISGGAERQMKELDGAIAGLQWTPDGKRLVFALRYNDSHFIDDEKKKKEPPVYRHITRLFYRLDGSGFLPKDCFQIYVMDIASGDLRRLTRGKRDNYCPTVSRDGRWVAYVSNRARDEDLDPLRQDIFLVPLRGGKERKIPTPAGQKAFVAFSPDCKTIAYLGHDNPDDPWGVTNTHVWTVGLGGKPKARDLMPKFDRQAYDQSISDLADMHGAAELNWSGDGRKIFFLCSDTGATNLYYITRSGGKPTRIFRGKCHIKAFSTNGRANTAAIIYSDIKTPGEIMVCPAAYAGEKKAKTLTKLNPFLNTEVKLGRTRDLMFRSPDGTQVQGWLVTPPDSKPGRKYPAILNIHGGPRVQYAHTFFHEMQYLAAKGFVVFYSNPRGGAGRGETWADAIAGCWGGLDYKDCMAAADFMEKQKFIDGKRMGVTGGSYGGFMTNWIIGHTNRFAAAVTQRSVVDLRSFYGSSDIGWMLSREYDGHPWTNREMYEQGSPIEYFEKVKTPVLIIHSENDLRCNIEQAEQMFVKLKVLGKRVELVRFPDEPHGLSRHGRPDRRIARLEWIDRWFRRYLKKGR